MNFKLFFSSILLILLTNTGLRAQSNPDFYVENGTCKCPNADYGDTGTLTINGQTNTFTKRDRAQLNFLLNTNESDPQIALTCTSGISNMGHLFFQSTNFNQNINHWDTSNVNDMSSMFGGATSFNQPIGSWDTSNVTDMMFIFSGAHAFNQDISLWDTSNLTHMNSMFKNAKEFNQDIGSWDTSNVIYMERMFEDCESFNQDIGNWDMSNVKYMTYMFHDANSFNQYIGDWDTSNVLGMYSMFNGASSFNQSLNNWDVSNVSDMNFMFYEATSFNGDIVNWDTSNVDGMAGMFIDAFAFNQDIGNWDTSNVIHMSLMFRDADSFNQNLSNWDFATTNLANLISNSGMDSYNYDLLIDRLVELNINNGTLGAENIEYCDDFSRQQLVNAGWNITDGGQGSDCDLNYVSGSVLYDISNDGCDPNDYDLSNYLINVNNGTDDAAFDIDEYGEYIIALNSGIYNLDILNYNSNFSSNPTTQTINFASQNEIMDDVDFCITANQQFSDLAIDFFPLEDAIPGFESNYQVVVSNNGTQTASNVQVTFDYDSNFQTYVSSTETPSSNTTNLLTYDFTNIQPFSNEIFEITMLNAVPPTLNGGEVLTFTLQVTPDSNDYNIKDNLVTYDQTVVNSFDPNDKLVIQGDEIADEDKDQYLDYRIRFQNVGTANALNVKITDTISDKLDWSTFQPISASHDYRIELKDQKEIDFYFDNIDLPFETEDPEGSNGFITYKIKPKSDVIIGDIIENKAYIFFDFNAPIITNTVSTEIVDNLSTTSFVQAKNIKLSPNPAENQVEIINASNAVIQNLQLYSIKGQLINTFTNKSLIDISSLSSGVYILQIETQLNKINKRLIKR